MQPRKHNRYRLGLPVIFSWKSAQRIQHQGVGLTRDLSVRGAFIFTLSPPPLKATIGLKVILPPSRAAAPLGLLGQGEVVRVEPAIEQHRAGFAVAARPFVLRRGKAQPRSLHL